MEKQHQADQVDRDSLFHLEKKDTGDSMTDGVY